MNVVSRFFFALSLGAIFASAPESALAYTPSGPPLATGQAKFFGSVYSPSQAVNFSAYFNQVTPENGGKWGSVEGTRDVMNWTDLDAAYALAKDNGYLFKMHNLIWGAQQPTWIESLSAADQLTEIKQWFSLVAARYPGIDLIDVVNEPLHTKPNKVGAGNYIGALGGDGATGWDWVLSAYRLARTYFPNAKLLINEYGVSNDANAAQRYITIINLLKAENLIDGIGIQAHAFETTVSAATTKANLDTIAATGLPIYVSEFDIDGPTDAAQLADYQRIFPVFWEHPSVVGVTLWGYRPGLWRDAQGAALVLADGTEKPAMTWLKGYIVNHAPVVTPNQTFYVSESAADGANVGTAAATDADGATAFSNWQITGGTGASVFAVSATTGQLTVLNHSALNASSTPSYTLNLTTSDGRDTSAAATVTVQVYAPGAATTRLVNIATRAYCSTGNSVTIGGFVITGSASKRVLVRAVGPSLTAQGLGQSEVLLDPSVEVHQGAPVIASNDNWGDNANAAEITSVSAQIGANALAAGDTKSSALLLTLSPGVYSFVVSGKNSTSGVVLLEVYDADAPSAPATFVNIATRAYSTTGNGVTIGGFVISGSTPKTVLLRAVGPTLTSQGLGQSEVLADPTIELHQGAPILASNDNWGDNANAADIVSTGARIGATPFANGDTKSSALLITLPAGVYSFIARGKSDTSGVVLVEVYDAD